MATPADRTAHPFATYDEMHAQPVALAAALVADPDQRDHIAKELAGTQSVTDTIAGPGFLAPSFVGRGRVFLTGCGTAMHAALTGADWFTRLAHGALPAQAVQAFEFTNYPLPGKHPHDALLALSHSGTASATIAAAEFAKAQGMYTVAVTAAPDSPLAQMCDEVVLTMRQPTVAATYTISHTTMLAVLADLARRTADHLRDSHEHAAHVASSIAEMPDQARAVLAGEDTLRQVIAALPAITQVIMAGGGPNWTTALEGALKVREAAYLPAQGFEMEEVLHGPIASFDQATLAVLIVPSGSGRARALDVLRALKPIGAPTITLGAADDAELAHLATHHLPLPVGLETFSVLPATILVQEIAYWLAMARGANPDRIRREQPEWAAARQQYTR